MTDSELECLKSHLDRHVEIDTRDGEHLLIKVISVFDQESEPDVFFDLVPSEDDPGTPNKLTGGYSLPLAEITSVQPVTRSQS
jgi:hypothetical protein